MKRVIGLILLFSGCAPSAYVTMRAGGFPPRPKNCDIQFKYQSIQKPWDTSKYTQVGILGVDFAETEWTERMKSAVQPKACELGGEVATIATVGENALSGAKGAVIMVYRAAEKPGASNPDNFN